MKSPFTLGGNPRFCTQYNNSETGENIGPMLSGTSTWLTLSLLQSFGIEFTLKGLKIDPILRKSQEFLNLSISTGKAEYEINISKPKGFYRILDGNVEIKVDGIRIEGNVVPAFTDRIKHVVYITFKR